MGFQHDIRQLWTVGERCTIKGETDVYKVSKIYTDNYDNKKHIYLKSTVRELGLDLIDDRNLVKLTDKDNDNTQLRMSSMLMIFMLK